MPCLLDRSKISLYLPQTGFMLLPQRFESDIEENKLIGEGFLQIKKGNRWLKNHFGIAPGIMLLEFLNQTAALLGIIECGMEGKIPILLRLKDPSPEFSNVPVIENDALIARALLTKSRRGMFFFTGSVFKKDGTVVLETGITGAAVELEKIFSVIKKAA